jgi:hypothetical protein
VVSQVYDWVVYRLGGIFGSVGHRVKIHKITSVTGKERDDLEIKDYVVLQKPQEQVDRLPPPRTFILDFTLTHTRYHSSHVHTTGQMTNTRCSDGEPEFDGTLREVSSRKKILHYHQLYINRPDPIVFLPVEVDTTTGRLYDDFSRLLFLQDHREKTSVMRISIPLDLSSRPFIPLSCLFVGDVLFHFELLPLFLLLGVLTKRHMEEKGKIFQKICGERKERQSSPDVVRSNRHNEPGEIETFIVVSTTVQVLLP